MLAYHEQEPERATELASLVSGHSALIGWDRGKSLDLLEVIKELACDYGIEPDESIMQ